MNDYEQQQNAGITLTIQPSTTRWRANEASSIAATPIQVKYIFLDVADFTNPCRTTEDQTAIVQTLNCIVTSSVAGYEFYSHEDEYILREEKGMIFLPTGDGMCIALLNLAKYPEYNDNVNMDIALSIVESINNYNKNNTQWKNRKFKVRIGLNEHKDNMVLDINRKLNIVGYGINMASRIMNLADCNQILVGEPVFNDLKNHEKYSEGKFEEYYGIVKHDYIIKFYQFIGEHKNDIGLNTEKPRNSLSLLQYKDSSYYPTKKWSVIYRETTEH